MSNNLLNNFLNARALIDRDTPAEGGKEKKNVMEKPMPQDEDSIRMIIETKPNKKKIMEFLKRRIVLLTDDISSD